MNQKQDRPSARPKDQDFAVIGLSQFGGSVARRLEALGYSVLGIDSRAERAKSISGDITEALILDAANEAALDEADIGSYHTVIVAIASDFEACALVTAALKSRGVPEVICLARDRRHRDILLHIGADRVVLPMEESGLRLADELATPGTTTATPLGAGYTLSPMQVSGEAGVKTVAECELQQVSILALLREDTAVLAPPPDYELALGDILVVMGRAREVTKFAALV